MFVGPLIVAARDGKMVLKLSGSLEQVEVGRGRVIVRAGQTDAAEVLLEASRLVTFYLDLDGRRDEVRSPSQSPGTTLRLTADQTRLRVSPGDVELEKITLQMPGFKMPSANPERPDGHRK
jgi:hypothetical protein